MCKSVIVTQSGSPFSVINNLLPGLWKHVNDLVQYMWIIVGQELRSKRELHPYGAKGIYEDKIFMIEEVSGRMKPANKNGV
jgi:hypothetical protein